MLNISEPAAASTRVSMQGRGYSSFGQNLLRVVKSMHILQLPFFFGTMTMLANHSGYVKPGAAGLLIGIEYSRVRDRPWMYLTSFVTTRIGVELAAVQRKLPDCVVVGLQL